MQGFNTGSNEIILNPNRSIYPGVDICRKIRQNNNLENSLSLI